MVDEGMDEGGIWMSERGWMSAWMRAWMKAWMKVGIRGVKG